MSNEIKRHPDAVAWDKFAQENPGLFELSTLGRDPKYLRNRLRAAFASGIEYARNSSKISNGSKDEVRNAD
jgi:hypothetical protein